MGVALEEVWGLPPKVVAGAVRSATYFSVPRRLSGAKEILTSLCTL